MPDLLDENRFSKFRLLNFPLVGTLTLKPHKSHSFVDFTIDDLKYSLIISRLFENFVFPASRIRHFNS